MQNSAYFARFLTVLSAFLLICASSFKANAQGIVAVSPVFFHVDSVKNIILINAPIHQLNTENATGDTLRVLTSGRRSYTFTHPVTSLHPATSYEAQANGSTYRVFFTQIPIIQFSTKYQIVDTPSVYARMVLTDTTGIVAATPTGIEFRGASSQSYPKKSYELILWADTVGTTEENLSLLGMRTDSKWNLQAMYNDPLRVRIKVANELWQNIDQLYYQAQEPTAKNGIALAYAEVLINGSYQGIYTLTERVDKKQLKLKKYANGIKGELYKGIAGLDATVFAYVPPFNNASEFWGGFQYQEPSQVIDWTNLHSFADFVVNSADTTFYAHYKSRFNLENAVDYYLFINLIRATDNTGKNAYIAKYNAGEPYYYVPWDLDGVLGDDWTGANANITNDTMTNGFFSRLNKDFSATGFRPALTRKWLTLRTSVVTNAAIMARINANVTYLLNNDVYERENLAWPAFQYDAQQVPYAATWLINRINYLDGIFGTSALSAGRPAPALLAPSLYPNPATSFVYLDNGALPCQVTLTDLSGKTVLQASLVNEAARINVSNLAKGIYLATIKNATATTVKKLAVE